MKNGFLNSWHIYTALRLVILKTNISIDIDVLLIQCIHSSYLQIYLENPREHCLSGLNHYALSLILAGDSLINVCS